MQWRRAGLRISRHLGVGCRGFSSKPQNHIPRVQELEDWNISGFRSATKDLQIPAVLRRLPNKSLPASDRWFLNEGSANDSCLNHDYLEPFGETHVPLELTMSSTASAGHVEFRRTYAPLSLFLRWTREAPANAHQRLYLAQCQIMDLPAQLRDDLLPTPDVVLRAGRGDVYDANVWIGRAPTYTPLHRDPNPNLFYQLAGRKVVRLFPPDVGERIYRQARSQIAGSDPSDSSTGSTGSSFSATGVIRGEEMMAGAERVLLEQLVWSVDNESRLADDDGCQEAALEHGQALFIPLRWWHSIKGLGTGVTGSVNWWFR